MTPEALVAYSSTLTTEQVTRWVERGWLRLDAAGEIADEAAIPGLIAADLLDPPEADTHTAPAGPIRSTMPAPSSPADSRRCSR
jgi:hypothetical protein